MKRKASYAILSLLLAAAFASYAEGGAEAASVPAGGDAAASSDDALFGEEQVTEASAAAQDPSKAFIKYDATKVGGSVTSSLGYTAVYMDGADSLVPDYDYLSPTVTGRVTLTAKPATDFGVNMDFRMSYPYSTSYSFLKSASLVPPSTLITTSGSVSVPSISVWALYSKFSLGDKLFMSFGKQPMAWGVARGFFQPADNIFAESAVDYGDYSAEREGPLAFKAMYSIPKTMTNFYFYAGLPPNTADLDLEDLRLAAKAEFNAGNTEFAFGAFYGYNDHPRALAMATTGIGAFNLYGEAVGKYGSERYFLSKSGSVVSGAQESGQLYFSGTVGGYYTGCDGNLTILAQYYYNGEGQDGVSAQEAYTYYLGGHTAQADSIAFATHNVGLSISRAEFLNEDLTVGLYAIASLSDLSGFVVPSATWKFSDYFNVKLSAAFDFGEAGDQYILSGPDFSYMSKGGNLALATKSGVAVSLLATLGTGSF
jgi:hypothetical protein